MLLSSLELLKNKNLDRKLLISHGFIPDEASDNFLTKIFYSEFSGTGMYLKVEALLKENTLVPCVIDIETGDPYTLYLTSKASGEFVGKIRFTVNEIFADIINSCSVKSRLSLCQSLEVLSLCEKRYGTVPEYPWDDLQAAVLRNEKTRKWYGLIIAVSTDKLGLKVKPDPSYKTEILLLHHTKEDVARLVDGVNFIPAWHMNKKSWFACVLDGRLTVDVIMSHVDISYNLSAKKH